MVAIDRAAGRVNLHAGSRIRTAVLGVNHAIAVRVGASDRIHGAAPRRPGTPVDLVCHTVAVRVWTACRLDQRALGCVRAFVGVVQHTVFVLVPRSAAEHHADANLRGVIEGRVCGDGLVEHVIPQDLAPYRKPLAQTQPQPGEPTDAVLRRTPPVAVAVIRPAPTKQKRQPLPKRQVPQQPHVEWLVIHIGGACLRGGESCVGFEHHL